MINDIAKSVKDQFDNDATLAAALSGLYFQRAPQAVTFDYGIFYINNITQDEIMGSGTANDITKIDIQFSLFTNDKDGGYKMAALLEKLRNAYHWQTMSVTDYTFMKMQQVTVLPIVYEDEVWQVSADYEMWITT